MAMGEDPSRLGFLGLLCFTKGFIGLLSPNLSFTNQLLVD